MTVANNNGRPVGRLLQLAQNVWTLAGVILTTVSGVLLAVFIIAGAAGELRNPYTGIFAFLILPGIFAIGLVMIPIGMLLRRRRLRRAAEHGDEAPPAYPRIDLNIKPVRRAVFWVALLTLANAVLLGSATYLGVHHMETVEFCGETCHTVMQPEFTAYQQSPHSRVACVECHIGPGASWFVRSKLDGLRQVWHTAFDTFERPIHTPLRTLRPARETCEQCHWPGKHHGDKVRLLARFRADEANSAAYSAMLVKTGGGSLDLGRHGGIHWWHIESDNRIRFVAADDRREEIVWVELTTPGGEVRVYRRDPEDLPDAATIDAEARIMDCVDCHNRPTHRFPTPERAMDQVLLDHAELRSLPYYKREAVRGIRGEYATREQGIRAVERALLEFYAAESPDLRSTDADLVERGAALASTVYGRLVFPEMDTNWETHPNHIGHDDFPGCFRCHDGEMVTADDEHVIPLDCETCHVFLVEDAASPPDLASIELTWE